MQVCNVVSKEYKKFDRSDDKLLDIKMGYKKKKRNDFNI